MHLCAGWRTVLLQPIIARLYDEDAEMYLVVAGASAAASNSVQLVRQPSGRRPRRPYPQLSVQVDTPKCATLAERALAHIGLR